MSTKKMKKKSPELFQQNWEKFKNASFCLYPIFWFLVGPKLKLKSRLFSILAKLEKNRKEALFESHFI